MHDLLMRKIAWYRRWHQYRYHDLVHYAVFSFFVCLNLYLLMQLQIVTA
jgi:hypothetical protein